MSRITSTSDEEQPLIDRQRILGFFEQRAAKVGKLGPTQAVIYQDNNPELAMRRDEAEKNLLLPLLGLNPDSRILDVGCGTGRWAELIIPLCQYYHGFDLSPGLINVARERFAFHPNAQFTVCEVDGLSSSALNGESDFTHIVSFGVFIYLNDAEVTESLRRYTSLSARKCRVAFREPIALQSRLTLQEHYSDDMQQEYNAIYRTEVELTSLIREEFDSAGFSFMGSGDVYADPALNNRVETRMRWQIWERCA